MLYDETEENIKSLEEIIKTFQPHYKEKLTLEDAREIRTNIRKLCDLLLERDDKRKRK